MDLIIEFFKFIFTPHSPIAVFINNIIIFVAATIVVWITIQTYRIRSAYRKFSKLRKYFDELDEKEHNREKIEVLLKKPAYYHPWLMKKMDTVKKLKDDTNATIDAIDNIDTNLRWVTYGILRYPAGSLIVLGLLGTIAGLQKAIYSLLPAIQAGNQLNLEAIKEVMVGTLTGMQTAFSTTLAGLFCSIVLGFLISLGVKGYFDRYITAVKSFLIETAIPLYSVIDEKQVKSLTDHTKELKIAIKDLAKQSSTLFQPIVESADRISMGVNKMFEAAQSFVTASDSINNFNNTLKGNLTTLGSTLKSVMESIDKFNNIQTDIESTLNQITGIPQQINSVTTQFQKFMSTLSGEFRTHQGNLQKQHEKIVAEQMKALTKASGAMSQQVEKVMQKVGETSTKLTDANKTLDQSIEKATASQKEYAQQYLSAYKKQYETIQSGLNDFLEKSRKEQDHQNKQVVDAVSSWVEYNQFLSELLQDMRKLPGQIAKAVREGNGQYPLQIPTKKEG